MITRSRMLRRISPLPDITSVAGSSLAAGSGQGYVPFDTAGGQAPAQTYASPAKLSVSTSFDGDALNVTATMRTVADVASVIAMLSAVGKLMKDS